MYFYVAAIPPGLRQFVTVARFSLWLADPDSFLESARSDSRFRRDCFAESCPLWPWSVAHLFIWNDSQFGQPLAQLAIDWEESWAHSHFFLQRTPAHQRNTNLWLRPWRPCGLFCRQGDPVLRTGRGSCAKCSYMPGTPRSGFELSRRLR